MLLDWIAGLFDILNLFQRQLEENKIPPPSILSLHLVFPQSQLYLSWTNAKVLCRYGSSVWARVMYLVSLLRPLWLHLKRSTLLNYLRGPPPWLTQVQEDVYVHMLVYV